MEANVPRHVLKGVSFNSYNSNDILELSVKEITNPQTFDSLLHPTSGGLYDPKLGPTDRDERCQTCGLGQAKCPGHMGHITLPLPMYNPVFFNVLYQVLKGTCFECHRLTVHSLKSSVLVQKFRLLEHGLLSEVADVDEYITHLISEYDVSAEEKILELLNEMVLNKINSTTKQDNNVKNVEACKNAARKEFIKEYFTVKGKCVHCKAKRLPLRKTQNAKIMLSTIIPNKTKKSSGPKKVTQTEDDEEEEGDEEDLVSGKQVYVTSADVRDHLRQVWQKDGQVLVCLFNFLSNSGADYPTDAFFIEIIPVPPSRFRPVSSLKDKKFENPQTMNLCNVLKGSALIRQILSLKLVEDEGKEMTEIEPTIITEVPGDTLNEKLQNAWVKLQTMVNCILDGDADKLAQDKLIGVKQILEKKEGLFRKNMMGKRVNFAARSVISPDPCISTNEIGIPEVFAKKLTFPQPVTPWNVHELRQAVINGPNCYPGASLIEMPDGSKMILNHKEKVQREAIAKQLLTPLTDPQQQNGCKVVHRHLWNGDVLLINRQPTLHRPSIQAHKARVLPGEKTLRLHYANCKAYNADFDGDEMNAHFPQTQLGRAEAYTIACTDYQYLVPKDGTPLAGLIQDHMVSGVSLTIRGRFFNRNEYCQLVYMALVDKRGSIKLLPPSMIKPCPLWSGKQVLSTLLHNIIPKHREKLNLTGKSKIPEKSWIHHRQRHQSIDNMGESHVIIRGSELLCGVLDKGHYGNTPYGLVHCCYELYGGEVAGSLLSCLGRLFMNFLQQHRSFSLGVEDILVTRKANQKRKKAIQKSGKCGPEVATQALGLDEGQDEETIREAMMDAQFDKNDRRLRELDLCMKGKTDNTQNAIVGACMPKGLEKLFPANNLQLMVQSGAKGSSVNCMQISGLLGQIELEGRRPPLMLSGKTLPSFLPYDTSPRAGGFVAGRFLTGIRPQEYFFHCMAGREGLIDTAVKTSRSGYLQRCLIKHLEGVMVNYDMTVRDSDGSVIQFYYGEDGLDVSKCGFLSPKQFPFLIDNSNVGRTGQACDKKITKRMKKIKKWNKSNSKRDRRHSAFLEYSKDMAEEEVLDHTTLDKSGRSKAAVEIITRWRSLGETEKERYMKYDEKAPEPVTSMYRPFQYNGVLPESFLQKIQDYSKNELPNLASSVTEKNFMRLLCDKAKKSFCQPGEAVGLLCAQSIGEPSTQMTLNTFHFAGRGEMNVTLGIPRLVEILMVASQNIKTPSMEVPILAQCQDKAKSLQTRFNKVVLSEVLEKVTVNEYLAICELSKSQRSRVFKLRFNFLQPEFYKRRLHVTPSSILYFMENTYIRNLLNKVKKKISDLQKARLVSSGHVRTHHNPHTRAQASDDEDSSDVEENDNTASDVKERQKKQEEQEYEEEEKEVEEKDEEEEDVEMDDSKNDEDEEDMGDNDSFMSSVKKESKENRIQFVLQSSSNISDYKYDVKKELWCEFTLQFGLLNSKIDLTSLIEEHAKETVIHCVPGINRCLLKEVKGQDHPELHICTEGINILEMYTYTDILDLNRLYSNDIHAIAGTYGIEAANKVIIKEIKNVFAAYGIEVDYRHLSLLADYMTFEGTYKAFNRRALETCASCLQQMSFETTMSFLVKASMQGANDKLKSPSAQIVTGKPVSCGSGTFDLLYRLM
ncbi:DNA-directed RNA polymerase I subunit RPA1-like [Saccostrea echinata]|uniref:DNA-directed RNA polymerase I subunit RPA1-like n=1 Tax=Saccostrea echinata TaxID=191078 RepID=UPI002A82D1D1|nr:DNA-directed RNA polymerase I subunit RPA1-like [Saccostrea echinata]